MRIVLNLNVIGHLRCILMRFARPAHYKRSFHFDTCSPPRHLLVSQLCWGIYNCFIKARFGSMFILASVCFINKELSIQNSFFFTPEIFLIQSSRILSAFLQSFIRPYYLSRPVFRIWLCVLFKDGLTFRHIL